MTSAGLYCPAGDFYIDPVRAVPQAIITHAHADHARAGCGAYVCSTSGADLLRQRVGKGIELRTLDFKINYLSLKRARISLHPAGHILGSAQVRIETDAGVAVVTGDYNATHAHPAAEPWEPLACDLLVTECTFGLPVYRWPEPSSVMTEINDWWRACQREGLCCVLPAYPLGKTQRLLAGLDSRIGPIALAGAGRAFLPLYARAGVHLPDVMDLDAYSVPQLRGCGFIIHSSAGDEPARLSEVGPLARAAVSGWLVSRAARRWYPHQRGWVLSDHSDWDGLLRCIRNSGARRIALVHGQTEPFARYLREFEGLDAFAAG